MPTILCDATDRNAKHETVNWDRPVGDPTSKEFHEALLRHWYPHILVIAKSRIYLAQCEDASLAYDVDDLAQDIAILVIKRFKEYQPEAVPFRVWLCQRARQTTFELRRKIRRRAAKKSVKAMLPTEDGEDGMTLVADTHEKDPAELAEDRDFWQWGSRSLEECGRVRERKILFFLRYECAMTDAEIAEEEGFTRQVTTYYVNRGLKLLATLHR